jgi:hypothetical protein
MKKETYWQIKAVDQPCESKTIWMEMREEEIKYTKI